MAFMGYETPVEMPSMGVYNTDLMKMYIAGVKDLYEKGQEEMKDFLKTYGDFYSPVEGATEAYNNMTIGGARNMISQMIAAGIDPYKSPEARAAIKRYIASVPTGALKALEQQREDYNKYQDAVRTAIANGTYNAPMEQYYLQKEGLNDFKAVSKNPDGSIKVNNWTRLAPSKFVTLESITNPFFKDLEKIDFVGNDPKHPGYSLYKVADDVLADALRGGVDAVKNNPNGDFFMYQAEKKLNNAGITRETNPDNYDRLVVQLLAQDVKDANAQAWLTKSDWDKYGQEMRGYRHAERMESIRHNNTMIEKGNKWDPKTKTWISAGGHDSNATGGLSLTDNLIASGAKMTAERTKTSNISKGLLMFLQDYLAKSGQKKTAKGFLDTYFLQSLSPQSASILASGIKNLKSLSINYRPGRDGMRFRTYEEVANNISTGGIKSYTFGGPTKYTYDQPWVSNSDNVVLYLNNTYDENDAGKIKIVFNGGAYSVLEADDYYHTYAPATVIVYGDVEDDGKRKVLRKERMPYEIAVPMHKLTGEQMAQYAAEGAFNDQKATHEYGFRIQPGNSTVRLL